MPSVYKTAEKLDEKTAEKLGSLPFFYCFKHCVYESKAARGQAQSPTVFDSLFFTLGTKLFGELAIQLGGVGEHRLNVQPFLTVVVVLGDLYYHSAKTDHADKVGDSHQGVEHIVETPNEIAGGNCTHDDQQNEDNAKNGTCDLFLALEHEFSGLFTVIRPSEDGGECEEGEDDGIRYLTEDTKILGKSEGGDNGFGKTAIVCDIGKIVFTGLQAGGEVQITKVSRNTSKTPQSPCFTGSLVSEAECAITEEPRPASLEKIPLAKP